MSRWLQTEPPVVVEITSYIRTGRTPGIYRIPCEWGKVYIGQTGCSMDTRLKEHQRYIRLEHPDKSAIAEHIVDLGHRIQFHKTSILTTKTRYMDHIVREAIQIELHPNNMNREVSFCLSHGSLSSVPSRNLLNMMPDLQDYKGQCTLAISRSEATGSMLASVALESPPPPTILWRL
jgi:hypothetical protein